MSTYPFQTKLAPLDHLKDLAECGAALQMSHPFRGLLMSAEINLLEIGANRAYFKGPCSQIGIRPGDQIYLSTQVSDKTLAGRVLEINIQQGMISVGDLVEVDRPWSERAHDRVQAEKPVRVILISGSCQLPTFLENLSLTGASLLAYKPAERGLEPRPGQVVKLDFSLPRGGHFLLPGRIANVDRPSSSLATMGVATFPNIEQARQLEHYITQRKSEILNEIYHSFNNSFESHNVTDLYF